MIAWWAFPRSTATKEQQKEYEKEFEKLEKRVEEIGCRGCQLSEAKTTPGSSIPTKPVKSYLNRVWMDMLCLDAKEGYWALGVVDEGTDDFMLAITDGKKVDEVYDALFERWLSLRGYTELAVTDQRREFISEEKFVAALEMYGTGSRVSAAGVPQAHGRI